MVLLTILRAKAWLRTAEYTDGVAGVRHAPDTHVHGILLRVRSHAVMGCLGPCLRENGASGFSL